MIVVFLSNKLITCDTILPVMMEVHRASGGRPIRFYCFEAKTYEAIRRNVVLSDAIDSIGTLELLGRRRKGGLTWLTHRVRMTLVLVPLAVRALAGRVTFIHFKALNEWPLRLLYLVNRRRTFFFEGDSSGWSELMMQGIDNIKRERKRDQSRPAAGGIVGFRTEWPVFQNPALRRLPRYVFGTTHNRMAWLDFVRSRADRYIARDFANVGLAESDEILVYILGYFGPMDFMRTPNSLLRLFRETLDILAEAGCGLPIFIKPHIITDLHVVQREVEGYPQCPIVITHLHPSVLATRAKFFVANYYSTTFATARQMNAPTVEYTDYSDAALEVTGNASMRSEYVSHFINGDRKALRRIVLALANGPRPKAPAALEGDDSGLIACLAEHQVAATAERTSTR